MPFINLTPHTVHFYAEAQFDGLEKLNTTTFVADGVVGEPIAEYPSTGMLRIATATTEIKSIDGVPAVATQYGEVTGVPERVKPDDFLIVSLPALSMAKAAGHPLAEQMVCPYQVVRLRSNTSQVLGAMGVSK